MKIILFSIFSILGLFYFSILQFCTAKPNDYSKISIPKYEVKIQQEDFFDKKVKENFVKQQAKLNEDLARAKREEEDKWYTVSSECLKLQNWHNNCKIYKIRFSPHFIVSGGKTVDFVRVKYINSDGNIYCPERVYDIDYVKEIIKYESDKGYLNKEKYYALQR